MSAAKGNSPKIAIADYGMGNLFSVKNALEGLGTTCEITSNKNIIIEADGLILPGVGAFGDAMSALEELDLKTTLLEYVESGRPLFGICLGMQLLFTDSEEYGAHKGLGIIPGQIKSLRSIPQLNAQKVPHVGWNKVSCEDAKSSVLSESDDQFMYFVHSYYCEPKDASSVVSTTNYAGHTFCSSVQSGNILATQFHPEKSHRDGLAIFERWISSIKGEHND